MIEVAIVAMEEAIRADGDRGPRRAASSSRATRCRCPARPRRASARPPSRRGRPRSCRADGAGRAPRSTPTASARVRGPAARRLSRDDGDDDRRPGLDGKLEDLARQYDDVVDPARHPGGPDATRRAAPPRPRAVPPRARRRGVPGARRRPRAARRRPPDARAEHGRGDEGDDRARGDRDARGARDGAHRRPPGLAHPARPERRPQRHRRDPGRRRRRGGGAVRDRAAAHVHAATRRSTSSRPT